MDESMIWALVNEMGYHETSRTLVDGEIVKMTFENDDEQSILITNHKFYGLSH